MRGCCFTASRRPRRCWRGAAAATPLADAAASHHRHSGSTVRRLQTATELPARRADQHQASGIGLHLWQEVLTLAKPHTMLAISCSLKSCSPRLTTSSSIACSTITSLHTHTLRNCTCSSARWPKSTKSLAHAHINRQPQQNGSMPVTECEHCFGGSARNVDGRECPDDVGQRLRPHTLRPSDRCNTSPDRRTWAVGCGQPALQPHTERPRR